MALGKDPYRKDGHITYGTLQCPTFFFFFFNIPQSCADNRYSIMTDNFTGSIRTKTKSLTGFLDTFSAFRPGSRRLPCRRRPRGGRRPPLHSQPGREIRATNLASPGCSRWLLPPGAPRGPTGEPLYSNYHLAPSEPFCLRCHLAADDPLCFNCHLATGFDVLNFFSFSCLRMYLCLTW